MAVTRSSKEKRVNFGAEDLERGQEDLRAMEEKWCKEETERNDRFEQKTVVISLVMYVVATVATGILLVVYPSNPAA